MSKPLSMLPMHPFLACAPDVIPADKVGQSELQKQLEAEFENVEWLPEPLLQEIESCFPSDSDIDQANEGQRCPNAYTKSVSAFFKVGRMFINYKQFAAAGQFLLDAWAVSSSHGAKSLICFYGAPSKKGAQQNDPKRQPIISPKQICRLFRVSSSFFKLISWRLSKWKVFIPLLTGQIQYSFVNKKTCTLNFFHHVNA